VQTLIVGAGSGVLDDPQRQFMAAELRGRFDDLLGLANTTDGTGTFLFAGYQSTTQPFSKTAGGVRYNGDQGQRTLQVGPQRMIALSEPGNTVFESIKTGNGSFTVSAASANTGSGIVTIGANATPTPPATSYEIRFTSDTEYDVYDVGAVPAAQVSTGNSYTSGQAITISGMQVEISGSPVNGDTFTLAPSMRQSVFATMEELIAVLERPAVGAAGQAALANGLNVAGRNLGNALDSVLSTRASVGARLRELDTLDQQGEDRNIQYAKTLTELQELDYTKAITDLTKQRIILEAAQQSFIKTSGLSLFNFL
jgi:flagellar hook-associated protein 3 FlgL